MRPSALPKTLVELARRDKRIETIELCTDDYDEEKRYYVILKPGFRFAGYYSTYKSYCSVNELREHVRYGIEEGEAQ